MSRRPSGYAWTLAALACAFPLLAPSHAHADTCSGLSLNALTPAAVGTTPAAVAVGDFDRDGRLDAAVVNSGSNNVSILLGNGSGGFTAATGSPIATTQPNPIDIAAGDLDRDGILDLVVAFASVPQAQVFRGLGGAQAGQFATVAPFNLATTPTRIYLADFTRDADLDLIVLAENTQRLLLYGGITGVAFGGAPLANLDLSMPLPGESPSGAAVLDLDRDGDLDLAVAMRNMNLVRVFTGNGLGGLTPVFSAGTGGGPRDVAAGDVNRDGWLDLVTADSAASTASVLFSLGGASLSPQPSVAVGGVPLRVALVDLDHDGVLDLAALDDSGTPRVSAFRGLNFGPPWFDASAAAANLAPAVGVRGLAVGRLTADGRTDLVTTLDSTRQAIAIENQSGSPCARSSFASAPRSYSTPDGPVSTATADFDHDGRQDLVVATANDRFVRILRNFNGGFAVGASVGPLGPAPRAVATADMDVDGDMDVVVAQGDGVSGQVQVYLGDGTGGLAAGAVQPAGTNTSALVVGDFNGDGAPDVVAASEGTGELFRFLGNGSGGLGAGTTIPLGASTAPRALVAADLNNDGNLDLAVANFGTSNVQLLAGNGDGTFVVGPLLPVGINPQGIATADLDGNGRLDLVTADNGSSQVSVLLQSVGGIFAGAVPYTVGTNPTAVALIDLVGDSKPDIAVTTASMSGSQTLSLLTNVAGAFTFDSDHPVRQSPQAITPIDADTDGLVDLAVPCRSADAVVVLIHRSPGPPVLQAAPRYAVRDKPRAAAAVDLDGDGDLDLAVANSGDNSVSLLNGDGLGVLSQYTTFPVSAAEAVVAADFNLDGKVDLAVSAPGTSSVEILFGAGAGVFAPQPSVAVGGVPDDLVAGDFDRDGDLDLAVCDKVSAGQVLILRNNGPGAGLGTFSVVAATPVGNKPTAIVAADFDRDGDLDLAVANEISDDVMILANNLGSFSVAQILQLCCTPTPDKGPISLATGDFDGDGDLDLAAAAFETDRLHVYRNDGASFATPPAPFSVPYVVQFVTAADVNLDGKPDLVAVAGGLSVFRGKGGMDFEPPETVVVGQLPSAAVIGDFNRDGRPDVAVVNEGTDDVSVLSSSACAAQHLEASLVSNACDTGAPFLIDATVQAFDDGGNTAACATGSVSPSIVPAVALGGPASLPFVSGIASFVGANGLTVNDPGRYRLLFQTAGMPPVQSRSFTLLEAGTTQILGPASVCPGATGIYSTNRVFDTYSWTLTPTGPPPFAYTPSVALTGPPLMGPYTLDLLGRDECVSPASRAIFFGDLTSVALQILGASSVCVDCIGGSAKAIETGGGTVVSRQWGYRTVSGSGAITPIPGETGETYVLKGASFPGPGTYYVVVTTTATCGPATPSSEWTVTVVASGGAGEVLHLAASSRGNSTDGQNRLLWVNTAAPDEIRIRWNRAPVGTSDCLPPVSLTAPATSPPTTDEVSILAPAPNMKDNFLHSSLALDTAYCYSVFVRVGAGWSPGRTVKARPFDSTAGPVKWAYATGGTAVAPPTVSVPAILAMSNDRTVHALTRDSSGGEWPTNWVPTELMGVAHSRSPVVPFVVPLGSANTVLFAADDAGFVHAVDAVTGQLPWPAQGPSLAMTGAPGGMFTQYGGNRDLLFLGTRDGNVNNSLRALNLADGTLLEAYAPGTPPGPIGPINGTPAIDYATKRIYFASHTRLGGDTLYCLEITDPPTLPVLQYKWSRNLGNITGSPVLRGGRVYVGTDAGTIYSLDALGGGGDRRFDTAPFDGPVKGFLFPDRRNDDLIFATETKVWSISDDLDPMTKNWEWTTAGLNPSVILFWPQTSFVYVGSALGMLYELDFTSANASTPPTPKPLILGGGLGQVGAPSLDIGVTPKLLLVGSEPGVLYGVQVPFP